MPSEWAVTVAAIRSAATVEIDGVDGVDLGGLLPALTAETLTHTWDLAMAIGKKYGVKTKADDAQNRHIFASVKNLARFVAEQRAATAS